MGYFDKLKELSGKAVGMADKFSGAVNDVALQARKTVEGEKDNPQAGNQRESQYPFLGYVFYPGGGMGMKTIFLDDYIQHGGDNIPYSDIRTVEVKHVATNNFTNGTAQATLLSGKTLTFAVKTSDMNMFLQAVGYANNKINVAHGGESAYKYGLQANDGTSIEVYDDYLIVKSIGSGLVGKSSKDSLSFTEIDSVSIVPGNQDISFIIQLVAGQQIVLSIPEYYSKQIQDATNHILQRKEAIEKETEEMNATPPVAWQPFTGSVKEFPLNGSKLSVTAEMDLFNSYRLKFRDVANEYSNLAKAQYCKKVHDLDTFLMFFMDIYTPYLDKIIQGGIDILIAEGIWSETIDSFRTSHTESFHLAIDDYNAMRKSLELTDQKNHSAVDNVAGAVPTLRGGGFGLKGAVKGIAMAEAFNFARDAAVNAVQKATQITPAQKAELFGRVNTDNLFNRVFMDYWNVYLTLVKALISNGKNIWLPNNAATNQAENISKNLSNPNFPQDRVTEVIIQILLTCPYRKNYQQLLHTKFGDTEEVKAINEYFGYSDFNDIRITG